MTTGLRLEFVAPPPLSILPPPIAVSSESNLRHIRAFLPDWISRGVVRQVREPQLRFFSHLFVVAKDVVDVRPIIDLSRLNRYLVLPSFKMETALKIALNILGPLWVQVGPEGRLFSRPCELAFPEVPGLCGRRADLCISVPSVRSVGRSLGLHKGDTAYKEPSSQVDVPGSLVFGRFSALGQDPRAAKQGLNLCPQPVQKSGLHHQRKEVFHHSFSGSGVLGGPLPVGLARADPSSGEGPQSGDTLRGNV